VENIFKPNKISEQMKNRRAQKKSFGRRRHHRDSYQSLVGTLASANINQKYIVKSIDTDNNAMKDFLFTLGCYEGEIITVISILSNQYVIVIKDARYSIDKNLALCIII